MFKSGSILKIKVKDFVTYSEAELIPGPNLNMLIGPNGTGKSTIVAAIILGLGGSPKTIGRGTNITEYIKHNCEEASIEISLQADEKNKTITIFRSFNKQGKNIWKLNDEKTSQKEVMEYIKEYKIQVDNLCQFLPQDRVADFAKMNKQELLKQTQIALCREDLMEKQQNLIEKRERHRFLLKSVEGLDKKLQTLKDLNLRLEGKVNNFHKRKKYTSSLEHIERKMLWVKYLNMVERRDELKRLKEEALNELQKHKSQFQPLEIALTKARKVVTNLSTNNISMTNQLRECETSISNKIEKYRNTKDSINRITADANAKIAEIDDRDKELKSTQARLDQLVRDKTEVLHNLGGDEQIQEKFNSMHSDIQKITNNTNTLEEKKSDLVKQKRQRIYEMRSLEHELERMDNVKEQRLNYLKTYNRDAYEGTLWLQQNKHLFKGEVFCPIMLEVNVINPKHAIYVENSIPYRDKVAFTCTLKEDMNLLIRSLRTEHNLKVNVVHSGEVNMTQLQPKFPIEHLRKYGFQAYVSTLFTAPEPIMRYLCKNYRLHNLPVAFQKAKCGHDQIPKEINTFYQENFRFSFSFSKYTHETTTRQVEINSDGSLSIFMDQLRVENLNGQLHELRKHCENIDEKVHSLEQTITEVTQQSAKIKEKIQLLRNSKQQVDGLDSRIRVTKNKISQMEMNRESKENIEHERLSKIKVVINKLLSIQNEIKELYKTYCSSAVDIQLNQIHLDTSRRQIIILDNKSQDLRQLLNESEQNFNRIKDEFTQITQSAKNILQKAKDISGGYTPDNDGFKKYQKEYDKLSDVLETLAADKELIVSKMDCLVNTANEHEMQEYDDRLDTIKDVEDNIISENNELTEIVNNMDETLRIWIEPLMELIQEINVRFGKAYKMMGCAGEVSIYKGENEKDFEQYGISIKVTYRNGEPLQELNTVIQSGGERAVATATFMLSLQELTPVPFRCVDEINQGMDVNNERRIFELLVDVTSQKDTSQYFLITPKLLTNLKYVPTMKIHIVHNGPFVCKQSKWKKVKLSEISK